MKRFGLIGHPISHSLSPALFKAGYNGKYTYDLIQGDDFVQSFRKFTEGYDGINVTAPFKELAFAKADILSEECRLTGAANILVKTQDGKVKAHNSDYLGIRRWLDCQALPETGPDTSVLVAGCGGAGKAAAFASASLGLKTILMNRDMSKAERLAERLPSLFTARPLSDFAECFCECGIIIYAIPTAIPELESLRLCAAGDNGHGSMNEGPRIILEANYRNPSFIKPARKNAEEATTAEISCSKTHYVSGREWLLFQAMTGYEIFTGEKPDLENMRACL